MHVPPLRERLSDIPFLVRHFLNKGRKTLGGPTGISPDALRTLMSYAWPGNVRELENVITRARVVAAGAQIEASDLAVGQFRAEERAGREQPASILTGDLSWEVAERRHVLDVLALCEGNKSRAAKVLGVSRRFLYYKLEHWEQSGHTGSQVTPRRGPHNA